MNRPVSQLLIFQHEPCEGLGYLDTFLAERRIEHHIVQLHKGESVPNDIANISGMVFLGSSHSVNDGLAWIDDELALVRKAAEAGLPVLGICFGAQLIARALGGTVTRAPIMQAGWFPVSATAQAGSLLGIGLPESFEVFEWHEDMFVPPDAAVPLFHGDCTRHQGFQYQSCLAIQFHPEFTENRISRCLSRHTGIDGHPSTCVQTGAEMLDRLDERLQRMHQIAEIIFSYWIRQTKLYASHRNNE